MITEKILESFWSKVTVTKEGSIIGLEEGIQAAIESLKPAAWMDDGSTRSGSEATSFRVVTSETLEAMPRASRENFKTALYAFPNICKSAGN